MSELRNIIDMRRYYAKTVFGFAVAKTNLPVLRLPDAAEFKSFEALEIQHEQLDAMSVFRREALLERFPVVHGGNLMDKSLSRNIISAPVKIQDDFIAESARLLKMIAAQYPSAYCRPGSVRRQCDCRSGAERGAPADTAKTLSVSAGKRADTAPSVPAPGPGGMFRGGAGVFSA
ncbi:MAG: hypothetical protein V8T87_01505 [Victivallales bacterium]